MLPRRVQPLAGWSIVVVFALIGAALLATVWSTRASVIDASDAVRRGQADAVEQAVRADLADLDGAPTQQDLDAILRDHHDEGLRYIAMLEGREHIISAESGRPFGAGSANILIPNRKIDEVNGRLRLELRSVRRLKAGGRATRFIIELDPVQATALRDAATLTLGVGGLAAAALLAVAFVLIRREARRHADARQRERERRLASLGEMSAVLAHEIKNPLASLKGNAQLLAGGVEDTQRPKAQRVVDEAVRLEKLVSDLLAFVRTGELERHPAAPASLVPDGVEADTAQAPSSWSLDEARMRQVITNLVENGQAAGGPVKVRIAEEGRRLVIEVSDKGPGVPGDERDKIFEPFFTKKTRGTGLGLSVARRVVEAHGGTIRVTDAPGGGALFRVEIPEA